VGDAVTFKSTSNADPGNGIIGMRERASALGGTVDAGPVPGGGFRVVAHLPPDRVSGRRP